MIPPQAVLLGWIFISFLFMADRDNARGFSLAMILGFLFLPERVGVEVYGLPNLTKTDVTVIGTLLGTIVFHPNTILKFRPHLMDTLLLGLLVAAVITSVANGFGAYDGFSNVFSKSMNFVLPICLARIHLGTPGQLKTFLLYLVLGGVLYAPLAVWEFRMSPQIHTKLYGYFQHTFAQFARHGYFRPVVCFRHALDLGRFFALCAFLAAFPLRGELGRRFPFGQWMFLAPLTGLILSMSYGPWLMFAMFIGLYFLPKRMSLLAYLIPGAAFFWLVIVFMGIQPLNPVVDFISRFNPERAVSAQYRLDAIRAYSYVIEEQLLFGHGGWGKGRIPGIATDSIVLIDLLARGLAGAACIYGWWAWIMRAMYRVAHKTANTVFGNLAYALAVLMPVCLAFTVFDAAFDAHVELIAGAMLAISGLALRPIPTRVKRMSPTGSAGIPAGFRKKAGKDAGGPRTV